MKRIWVVCVTQGVGYELNNCITESEFYGPYTEEVAERLAEELNEFFGQLAGEHSEAYPLLLDNRPRNAIRAHYHDELYDLLDEEN